MYNVVNILAQIADLKNSDYKNTLAICTIIELLIEKGILSRQELLDKSLQIDNVDDEQTL